MHPATITGILDRLEKGGWAVRKRDSSDRRAVVIQLGRTRTQDLVQMYAGMNASIAQICAGYDEAQLDLLAEFLSRIADAGRQATEELGKR